MANLNLNFNKMNIQQNQALKKANVNESQNDLPKFVEGKHINGGKSEVDKRLQAGTLSVGDTFKGDSGVTMEVKEVGVDDKGRKYYKYGKKTA